MTIDVETVNPLRIVDRPAVGARARTGAQFAWSAPYQTGTVSESGGALGRGTYHTVYTVNNPMASGVPITIQATPAVAPPPPAARSKIQNRKKLRGITTKRVTTKNQRVVFLRAGQTIAYTVGPDGAIQILPAGGEFAIRQGAFENGTAVVYGPVSAAFGGLPYLKVTATYTRTTGNT
ncbi:hypothetical protein [Marininema halotolerans]|uniref:Uncharacterized protein n=1 Tax=Marininema halotolerans TaxID=1155944 RepID=A0A1I6NUM7_9BACL|nr:hypothetical protein [Marininema halotolerans]SFS31595.1 hypothetical protein SAMN05444972_101145 [Marininema halotolerans]